MHLVAVGTTQLEHTEDNSIHHHEGCDAVCFQITLGSVVAVLTVHSYLYTIALQRPFLDINQRAADMWNYAVLLWELATREVPFAELSPMEVGMKVCYGCHSSQHVYRICSAFDHHND